MEIEYELGDLSYAQSKKLRNCFYSAKQKKMNSLVAFSRSHILLKNVNKMKKGICAGLNKETGGRGRPNGALN